MIEMGTYLIFILYFAIIFEVIRTGWRLRKVVMDGYMKCTLWFFLITLFVQAVSFIVLQLDWVTKDYDDKIADWSVWGWMIYDWANGLAHMLFVTAVRFYIGWKIEAAILADKTYRRRVEDMP